MLDDIEHRKRHYGMAERREGHFRGQNRSELYYQSWTLDQAPLATIVITHGLGEHSESYHKTAEILCGLGYAVYAWDLRGHGRSDGKRGHVEDFAFFADDLAKFYEFLKSNNKLSGPTVGIGHSMGGLISLLYQLNSRFAEQRKKIPLLCQILSSPALGISMPVPKLKDQAAQLLRKIWPSVTMQNGIKNSDLSSLSEFLNSYERDSLRHDKASSTLYFGTLDSFADIFKHVSELDIPLLVQAAGLERVVSLPAIKQMFEMVRTGTKKMVVYDQSLHEVYNDCQREQAFRDLDQFIRAVR
jgi:alpha-beta hydrolase superfamily lysophospholipase